MCDLAKRFPNARQSAALIRADVLEFARRFPFDEEELWQITAAVGEGVANAIEHGHAPETFIDVRCGHDEWRITIEIEDAAGGLREKRRPPVKSDLVGGRGLGIMRAAVDEVRLEVRDGAGATLYLSKVGRSQRPFSCPGNEPRPTAKP